MSILKFVLEIILPQCVRVTFECKERKLRGPNCALCGGSVLLLQRDTSFAIWVQTLFEVAFEIILHLKLA